MELPDELARRFPKVEGWSCAQFRGDYIFSHPGHVPRVARLVDGEWVVEKVQPPASTAPVMVTVARELWSSTSPRKMT